MAKAKYKKELDELAEIARRARGVEDAIVESYRDGEDAEIHVDIDSESTVHMHRYGDGTWWWQRGYGYVMEDEDVTGKPFKEALKDALMVDNPGKMISRACPRCKARRGQPCRTASGNPCSKPHAARVAKANPIVGKLSGLRDDPPDDPDDPDDLVAREKRMVARYRNCHAARQQLRYLRALKDRYKAEGVDVTHIDEGIRNMTREVQWCKRPWASDNPKKKTLKSRVRTAEKKAGRAAKRTGAKIERGAKKAARKTKKFAKTKTGYTAGGAGIGALALGPLGAIAGAVGGAALHDNPGVDLFSAYELTVEDYSDRKLKSEFKEHSERISESRDPVRDFGTEGYPMYKRMLAILRAEMSRRGFLTMNPKRKATKRKTTKRKATKKKSARRRNNPDYDGIQSTPEQEIILQEAISMYPAAVPRELLVVLQSYETHMGEPAESIESAVGRVGYSVGRSGGSIRHMQNIGADLYDVLESEYIAGLRHSGRKEEAQKVMGKRSRRTRNPKRKTTKRKAIKRNPRHTPKWFERDGVYHTDDFRFEIHETSDGKYRLYEPLAAWDVGVYESVAEAKRSSSHRRAMVPNPKRKTAKRKTTKRKTTRRRKNPSAVDHERVGMDALRQSEKYHKRYMQYDRLNDLLDTYKWLLIAHEELKYAGQPEPRIQARDGLKAVRRLLLERM